MWEMRDEALHPETRLGASEYSRVGKVCHSRFADATATSRSARAIRLDAARGTKVILLALAKDRNDL